MNNYSVRGELDEKTNIELLKYPELLRKLLFYRGIKTVEEAETFLNPVFDENNDPFKMLGMDKAVERIFQAIQNKEKIVIYSDYDADGIPGAVVLHDFFKKIGYDNFKNYIPHRVLEGFGLNDDAVKEFAKDDVKLIITVDCGIADVEESKKIKKLGIDLIITDHHLPKMKGKKEVLPEAIAILNHKQEACEYPDKNLCGSGVAFKLVQGMIQKYGKELGWKDGQEKWLLDMVGIATVSDMVPLVGENRIFASYGLKVLRKSPRLGLQKLLSIIKIDQKNIDEGDIGFMISPRINAASRMGIPEDAFNMLIAENHTDAMTFALHLNQINDERKGVVASLVKEIKKHWTKIDPEKKRKVLVAGNPDWKPSLLGLVASSLQDEHDGPVFLWGREEGKTLKGSCRSDGCVNVVEMMRESSDMFEEFGGHAGAGGFAVHFEKVDLILDSLEESYKKLSNNEVKEKVIADAVMHIDDVTQKLETEIAQLAPFGMDNTKPIFAFKNIEIADVKIFGKKNDHLKLDFKNSRGQKISAIKFFAKPEDFSAKIETGAKIDLLANIEKSFFAGRTELRLRIVDIF